MAVRTVSSPDELDEAEVIGFVAQKCGPCLQQRPIWDALPETVLVVDVDAMPDVRASYGVEALPSTVVRGQLLRGVQTTRQLQEALGAPVT